MNLALKDVVLALGQKPGMGRNRVAQSLDPRDLRLGEIAKHIIMHQRLVAGMADADPHAPVLVAEMFGYGSEAVMAGIAAAGLDPHLARRQIEFIVKDDDSRRIDLIIARRRASGAAGFNHVGLRLKQNHPFAGEHDLADEALKARTKRRRLISARDRIESHEAGIVAMAGKGLSHIAETSEKKHGARSEAF